MKRRFSLFCLGLLFSVSTAMGQVPQDAWSQATSAFREGRSAAQSAHSVSRDADLDARYNQADAAAEAEAAIASSQVALQKLAEARAALQKGVESNEIGPESKATLERYIAEYEAEARASAERARAARAALVSHTLKVTNPGLVAVSAPPPAPAPVLVPAPAPAPAPVSPAPAPTNSAFPNGSPDPNAVRQGDFGTCPFLAALISMAGQRPADLQAMIHDNGDGTYTVALAGQKPVTVSPIQGGAQSGADGSWASLLEQAYRMSVWVDGGSTSKGIEVLTGHDSDTDNLTFTSLSTTRSKLQAALSEHRLVTAGISGLGTTWLANKLGLCDLPDAHVYAVTGYDAERDVVFLRNPWGLTQLADGAEIVLNLSEFDKLFTDISYEELPEGLEVGVLGLDRSQSEDAAWVMSPHPNIEAPHCNAR